MRRNQREARWALKGEEHYRLITHRITSWKQPEGSTGEINKAIPDKNSSFEQANIEKVRDTHGVPQSIEHLPPTALDLILVGIIKGDDGYLEAVIEDREIGSQGLYRVNSTIRGAKVVMILESKVILRLNDKDQILDMNPQGTGDEQANALSTDEPNWDERSSLGFAQTRLKVRLQSGGI